MCRELRLLGQSITAYAGGFDARALTPAQAGEVVRLCARIEASAASIKALAAARSAEGHGWKHDGYRSAADHLAHETGMSPGAARRALEAGRRLADQPDVAAAATAGELSFEQAAAVAEGVAADPDKARELIDRAQRSSLPELNEQVALVKAAQRDQDEHHRAVHAKRSLRRWTDREGALHAHLYGHPEDGAGLWRVIDPIRRRLNMLRRERGSPIEKLDALDYDALMTVAAVALGKDSELSFAEILELGLFPQARHSRLADPTRSAAGPEHPASPGAEGRVKKLAGSPIRLMIRVDLAALVRGYPDRRGAVRHPRLRARSSCRRARHPGHREPLPHRAAVQRPRTPKRLPPRTPPQRLPTLRARLLVPDLHRRGLLSHHQPAIRPP